MLSSITCTHFPTLPLSLHFLQEPSFGGKLAPATQETRGKRAVSCESVRLHKQPFLSYGRIQDCMDSVEDSQN